MKSDEENEMIKIQMVLLLFPILVYSQTTNPWQSFVSSPNKVSFKKCEAQIKMSIPQVSDYDSTVTLLQVSEVEYRFLRLVAKGDALAMELCFQLYRIFPPGYAADREHFNGALGMSATHNPKAFLSLLCKYAHLDPFYDGTHYVDIDASFLILGVSDDLLDRLAKQKTEFTRRLTAIENVSETNCLTIKQKCMEELRKKIETLDGGKE